MAGTSGMHGPYSFRVAGLGTEVTGPSLTFGQQVLAAMAMDYMDHHDVNPGNAGVRTDKLESVMAAKPGKWLDDGEKEPWALRRFMGAIGGLGLQDVLTSDRDHFKFLVGPVVCLQAPQLRPATEGKAYKARMKDVARALDGRSMEEAGQMLEDATTQLLRDPDCNPERCSVPVPRIWAAVVQNPQDAVRLEATLGLTEKTFPDFLAHRGVFGIRERRYRQRTIFHVHPASLADVEAADARNSRKQEREQNKWKELLKGFLQRCNQQCCKLTEFVEAHQPLPYQLGDFVKLIRHWADTFLYDRASNMIVLISPQPPPIMWG
eukprot:EG_transcript_18588